jgi:cobalt/nickel transport system ATP-binding protein
MQPEVLFMDEPTAGLDYSGITSLNAIMASLHTAGTTLVVATHDVDWAWSWADLVYVLAAGRVVAGGDPEEILNRQDHAAYGYARPIVGEAYAAMIRAGYTPLSEGSPRTVEQLIKEIEAVK